MHCKTILTSFLPILLPVIHAATIGEVNGANQALASEVASFDGNVKELGDLSTLLEIQVPPRIHHQFLSLSLTPLGRCQRYRNLRHKHR